MLDPETGIDFPFFQPQVRDMFGNPEGAPFPEDYLRTLDLREYADALAHVLDYEGNPWGHRIYCNYVMHGPLKRAFGLLVERGLTGELKTYDGCFNIRRMKGGNSLSVHSWGLALDLNAATNQFGQVGDMSPEFIRCFADAGFENGSLWGTRDDMHFQLCWLRDWTLPQYADVELRPIPWQA